MSNPTTMHEGEVVASADVVRRLLREQFPMWADAPLRRVQAAGTDHVIHRLGDRLCVRLPRIDWADGQARKEMEWLPRFSPTLPLEVPVPVAIGEPSGGYPWTWSVGPWLDGQDASAEPPADPSRAAQQLAGFILALRSISVAGAPMSAELGLRGAPLQSRDESTRRALAQLDGLVDARRAAWVWTEALAAPEWAGPPTWHHGDLLAGNLLVRDGSLAAVVDFGGLGAGDPACDLLPAWSLFSGRSRNEFRRAVGADDAMWARGRGHAIAQAAVYIPYYLASNPAGAARAVQQLCAAIEG